MIFTVLLSSPLGRAQVSFTGTSASENFGSQAIGSPSAATTLNLSVYSGTTVGSIAIMTTGIAKLDFANAAGSTCMAQYYSTASACVVDVTFTPEAAGVRMGAVVFFSRANNTGTVLGSVPVYGVGTGPQIAYGPGTVSVLNPLLDWKKLLQNPSSIAADAAGDLFITDGEIDPPSYRLVIVPAGGGTPTFIDPAVNGQALYLPSCVAVDGAGDLFIGDFLGRVVEVPTGGGAATALAPVVNGIALNYPSGLAVDGAGDLFIGDYINNRVLEVPAGGGAAIAIDPEVNGISLDDPHGLVLDGTGDLFIGDLGNGRVVEVPAGGGAATSIAPTVNGEGLRNPKDVAVNGAGDLFIADNVNHRVVKVPAGGGAATGLDPAIYFSGEGEVYGVTVDAAGDMFIVQGGLEGEDNVVEEIQYSQPPALDFLTSTDEGSTDTTDGVKTMQIVNIGNAALTLTALSYPIDFSEAGGDSNVCTGSTSLSPGQECDVPIEFTPENIGTLNESVTVTDNAPNGNGAQQSIAVIGTGEELSLLAFPVPGSTLAGRTMTFTWTSSAGATGYYLSLGSTGVGSQNVFNSGKRTVTAWTATGLPTNGETIYARLTTYFGSVQMIADFTYTAASQAVLTAPVPGGVLPGTTATFTWTAGTGATGYVLWLGSTGVGSNNLYASQETATCAHVTNLPTNGETIYARLLTNFNGVLSYADYTYKATAQAVMTSPAPGTLLAGSTVAFTWTAGTGASGYTLWLGTTGAGSNNLYNSGQETVTSVIVSGLPTNLKPIYARLFTTINGVQVHADYTYLAQ